jgi:hypothetical protein
MSFSNWNFDHFEGSAKVGRFLGKFQWAFLMLDSEFKKS